MIKGTIEFPGDKSISHRALMIASISSETSQIKNLSNGQDVLSTKKCLKQCGISINGSKNSYQVKGGKFTNPEKDLDCQNSGTTIRLLTGLLAGKKINARLIGDESLSKRPMERIVIPLTKMGLNIKSNNGKLPILIKDSRIKGIDYKNTMSSAQVKSAVLFCGLGTTDATSYYEPIKSRNHTEIMLKNVGFNIKYDNGKIILKNSDSKIKGLDITIPGDPSAASFFAAAALILPKSELILKNILANPTRFGFFDTLNRMDANIEYLSSWMESGEKVKNIKIKNGPLKAIKIDYEHIPGIIDEIPILSIVASQADGKTEIRGAKELRVKESDRIRAIVFNLRNMGVPIEEYNDGFSIFGPVKLKGSKIKTFDDHRIAMAFSIAGLIADGITVLDNKKCVDISFPNFFKILQSKIK